MIRCLEIESKLYPKTQAQLAFLPTSCLEGRQDIEPRTGTFAASPERVSAIFNVHHVRHQEDEPPFISVHVTECYRTALRELLHNLFVDCINLHSLRSGLSRWLRAVSAATHES